MTALETFIEALARRSVEPAPFDDAGDGARSAVAALLRDGTHGAELLLIRRSHRPDDAWSGHLALPGGRVDPADRSYEETARRETHEEVGIDLLAPGCLLLGALPPVLPRSNPFAMTVHPFAWRVPDDVRERPDATEVAAAFWVPIRHLVEPAARVEHRLGDRSFPGVSVGDDVLWGMTLRIFESMLGED